MSDKDSPKTKNKIKPKSKTEKLLENADICCFLSDKKSKLKQ